LIGIGDHVALTEIPPAGRLCCRPRCDAFAHFAIEIAEVLLHFAEVGEQFARGRGNLQEAFLDARGVEKIDVAIANAADFRVDLGSAPFSSAMRIQGSVSVPSAS